jgi:hypothetical protein
MRAKRFLVAACLCLAALGVAGSWAIADHHEGQAAGEMPLPEGWTAEDMQNMIAATTPGKEQEFLAQGVGHWECKTTMWMTPTSEPTESKGTSTSEVVMDGRFVKCEMDGEMPGMGPYHGLGFYGYDNVAGQYVSTWIDNHGTGIMQGTGEKSGDGKSITWTYTVNCPIAKGPVQMRETLTRTGDDTQTLVMHGTDPKSGKEFKMMSIEMTRTSGGAEAGG